MTDAACISIVFQGIVFIAAAAFTYRMVGAAKAVIILACKADHGHGKEHALPCDCACHRAKK